MLVAWAGADWNKDGSSITAWTATHLGSTFSDVSESEIFPDFSGTDSPRSWKVVKVLRIFCVFSLL